MNMNGFQELRTLDEAAEEALTREVEIMKMLDHPHIVYYLGITKQIKTMMPCMVLEYLPMGSLYDFLKKRRTSDQNLPISALTILAHQLAQ
ncbi:hypothetical protein SARC_15715, partial [Sphaeroforma arctica JP610]